MTNNKCACLIAQNFWATAGADIDEVFIERRLKGKAVYGSESMGKVQLVGLAYQTTDDVSKVIGRLPKD